LVVDDDEFSRDLIVSALTQIGATQCHCAEDSEAALRLATQHRPDFVLLDIYMPGADGWSVLDSLRRALPNVVVLMITGSIRPSDFSKSMEKHVDGFCIKPVRSAILLKALTQARENRSITKV
jgi:CheY-like chemotaxis protein